MPICIECRYPISTLYTTYSKADDKALGKGVRLTQCPRCKRFADKYVEHDYVVQFIDLVLIKPQVGCCSPASNTHFTGLCGTVNHFNVARSTGLQIMGNGRYLFHVTSKDAS